MKRLLALFVFTMVLNQGALAQGMTIQQPQQPLMTEGQYIGGGVASLVLGWGIGHAIQGRYAERGWIFTVTQAAGTGLFVGGYGWAASNIIDSAKVNGRLGNPYSYSTPSVGGPVGLMVVGGLVMTASRIWEVVDSFSADYARPMYHASVEKPVASKQLAFMPLVSPTSVGMLVNF